MHSDTHTKAYDKPNRAIFKKHKVCPLHKSCKPKKEAYFVKISPFRFHDEYGWWTGKFEEDINTFEDKFKDFTFNSALLSPHDVHVVSKAQYDYVLVTFLEEEDALKMEKVMHDKDRNGYKFVAEIIKGEVVAPVEAEDGEIEDPNNFFCAKLQIQPNGVKDDVVERQVEGDVGKEAIPQDVAEDFSDDAECDDDEDYF